MSYIDKEFMRRACSSFSIMILILHLNTTSQVWQSHIQSPPITARVLTASMLSRIFCPLQSTRVTTISLQNIIRYTVVCLILASNRKNKQIKLVVYLFASQ